jgi:glycosyltransferase involved in cell wall biosynthesis
MNVFVMPSLNEGLPIALLEAQAAGLPCVVSDCVPSEANVSGPDVQFLALDLGPAKWADVVLRALDKPRATLASGPGRLEGTDFDIRISAARLSAFYRSIAIQLPQESI